MFVAAIKSVVFVPRNNLGLVLCWHWQNSVTLFQVGLIMALRQTLLEHNSANDSVRSFIRRRERVGSLVEEKTGTMAKVVVKMIDSSQYQSIVARLVMDRSLDF